jgi:ABC-type phosphate transport system substrate-binding protein
MKLNKKIRLVLTTIAMLFFSQTALSEILVIVHPNNKVSLSKSDLKRMFLGKMKKFPDGGTVLPINQAAGSEVKANFDKLALGKSASQIKAYWSKLVFSGKGNPPKELKNDEEVIQLVSENPAVIGYIDAESKTNSVIVVATF